MKNTASLRKLVSLLLVLVTLVSTIPIMAIPAAAAAVTPTVYSQLSDTSAFNYPGGSGSTYKSSGCGVYAVVNAVKFLTNKKILPHELGKFAISCGARVNGGILGATLCKKAAASDQFGGAYGFFLTETYTFGSSSRTMRCDIGGKKTASGYPSAAEWDILYSKLVSHLKNGEVAVVLVMGHYMCIVDYDDSTGKFLMLDSAAYTSKRLSQNKGKWQWVTADQLNYNKAPKANSSYNNQGPYIHLRNEIMFLAKVGGDSNSNTSHNSTNPDSYPVLNRDLVYKSGSAVKIGTDVKWLQSLLLHLGYSISVDGSYGPSSRDVVKEFQSAYGLTSDGMVGPNTRAKLQELWSSRGHTWGNATIVTAASHISTGTKTFKCNYCEAAKSEVIPVQGHSYDSWRSLNDTQHIRECVCGAFESGNHAWNDGTITKAATHTTEGVRIYTCTICSATKIEALAKISGHTYGSWQKHNADEHKKACACGEVQYEEHAWNNGDVTTDHTCKDAGIKTYVCTVCGETKTETISAFNHNFIVVQHDAEYHWVKCSRCDEINGRETHNGGIATCTFQKVCTDCGTPYGNLLPHDYEHGEWKSDASGHWKKCANCLAEDTANKVDHNAFDDNNCATAVYCSGCNYMMAAAKTHNLNIGASMDANDHIMECTNSGCEHIENVAHNFNQKVESADYLKNNADCTTAKTYYYSCECGHKGSTTFAVGTITDHDFEWVVDSPADKQNTGSKHEECTACHTKRHEVTVIDKIACDHATATKTNQVDADHHNTGKKAYWYCAECNQYFSDEACLLEIADISTYGIIAKVEHEFGTSWDSDANKHWHECTCGDKNDATAHTYSQEIVHELYKKDSATCTAPATYYKSCICGAKGTETYTSGTELDHDLEHHNAKTPTCTEVGWNAHDTCKRDGCKHTTYVELETLGHDFTLDQYDADHHWTVCSRCYETDGKVEHTYGDDIACDACDYNKTVQEKTVSHEETEKPTDTDKPIYDTDNGGCDSSIASCAVVFFSILGLGIGVVCMKKEE